MPKTIWFYGRVNAVEDKTLYISVWPKGQAARKAQRNPTHNLEQPTTVHA